MTEAISEKKCCHCSATTEEMRPYGPGGAWVCFPCAMKPENRPTTDAMFSAQLDGCGPVVVIGEESGPRPLIGDAS